MSNVPPSSAVRRALLAITSLVLLRAVAERNGGAVVGDVAHAVTADGHMRVVQNRVSDSVLQKRLYERAYAGAHGGADEGEEEEGGDGARGGRSGRNRRRDDDFEGDGDGDRGGGRSGRRDDDRRRDDRGPSGSVRTRGAREEALSEADQICADFESTLDQADLQEKVEQETSDACKEIIGEKKGVSGFFGFRSGGASGKDANANRELKEINKMARDCKRVEELRKKAKQEWEKLKKINKDIKESTNKFCKYHAEYEDKKQELKDLEGEEEGRDGDEVSYSPGLKKYIQDIRRWQAKLAAGPGGSDDRI